MDCSLVYPLIVALMRLTFLMRRANAAYLTGIMFNCDFFIVYTSFYMIGAQ